MESGRRDGHSRAAAGRREGEACMVWKRRSLHVKSQPASSSIFSMSRCVFCEASVLAKSVFTILDSAACGG